MPLLPDCVARIKACTDCWSLLLGAQAAIVYSQLKSLHSCQLGLHFRYSGLQGNSQCPEHGVFERRNRVLASRLAAGGGGGVGTLLKQVI